MPIEHLRAHAYRVVRRAGYVPWEVVREGVTQHNEVIPHSAFMGHTPDEMFFGTATELVAGLDERRRTARHDRIQTNRSARCGVCPGLDTRPPGGAGE